ncbi:MAG: TIM barrel protein [Alphaproteobacteria bacterium]|nr:TIM barrel protein [Alphaproteobacteria bacterium]
MPRLAANISYLFTEHAFLDRFAAAADHGFTGVEILVPYEHAPKDVAGRLTTHNLKCVLINTPYGAVAGGHTGLGAIPGREAEFATDARRALDYAQAVGCTRIHALAGMPDGGDDLAACRAVFVENLRAMGEQAAAEGVTVLIEPLNTVDFPGYFLTRQDQAHAIAADVGLANVRVQMDFYHCQVMEGNLAGNFRQFFDGVGHIQIASAPGRGEPDAGEINYVYLLDLIDELGFVGWVGAEYIPQGDTAAGLGWAADYGIIAKQ